MTPDVGNAVFEAGGACLLWLSIRRLHRDKAIKGVHWLPVSFFAAWGVWNLYFYAALDQWWSWVAGAALTVSNIIWVGQMFYYRRKR